MKFFAVAVVALAIVSECLTAERSRQRSGPIRSVPVAADIKRDVDFDCPEEFGYYPHPTDCTLYYVCVFGGALLESCTGGLMYSHELQTCDWPRNVGCDGSSSSSAAVQAAEDHEIERYNERDPSPPPPPRRAPPPPPPRAQPNLVVTSRGQPKFNREEYEQQQQLYAEVDDLPPVEEIETDRQQRVNRGQPSTIGQVQKDRDGYGSQVVSSRTLNPNIIPASIPQSSGKIGSFSFGTQVDERRTATATQAPQTYSEDKIAVTDSLHDRQFDIETNDIDVNGIVEVSLVRKKRDVAEQLDKKESNATNIDKISDRSSKDVVMEYIEVDPEEEDEEVDDVSSDDAERGKRQVRYYLKNAGFKNPGKIVVNSKPVKFVDLQQYNSNQNSQNLRQQNSYVPNNSQYQDSNRKPYSSDSLYSTANPFLLFQTDNSQTERPFKPSLPDFFNQRLHSPMNVATQIITKSPPISTLINKENPFSALTGGFFNNNQGTNYQNNKYENNNNYQNNNNQFSERPVQSQPNYQVQFKDSSLLPSTVVTGKPVQFSTTPTPNSYQHKVVSSTSQPNNNFNSPSQSVRVNPTQSYKRPSDDDDDEYDDEEEEEEEDSNKNDDDDHFYKHDFPKPPYEFNHPTNKYADIENPFANPNFDFDAFISKLRDDYNKAVGITTSKPKIKQQSVAVKVINAESSTSKNQNSGLHSSTVNYNTMSTPRPFTSPTGHEGNTNPQSFSSVSSTTQPEKFQKLINSPQHYQNFDQQHQIENQNSYRPHQQNAGIPVDAVRPKLKPPNFKDENQLPITLTFSRPFLNLGKQNSNKLNDGQQAISVTQKPYVFVSTSSPMIISTPKHHFLIKPQKIITLNPQYYSTGKPYQVSSLKPYNAYVTFKPSTQKPLTTLANEQLSALRNYWNNPSTEPNYYVQSTKATSVSEMSKLENLFDQAIKNAQAQKAANYSNIIREQATTTTPKAPTKRRPIPKPSPEMNDYYYDDEEEVYYVEPPVKSKYMPSTEVRPQRPPMAQNYKEYDDEEDSKESPIVNKPLRTPYRRPSTQLIPETATKNHNDVSAVTKAPMKNNKYVSSKMPVPVFVDFGTPATNIMRPQLSNYQFIHQSPRNRTVHLMKPQSGPQTMKPPRFLNQTTVRPYTVRHRLANPPWFEHTTPVNMPIKGRPKHPNIVVQKLTTPRDSHNQETRYTKTMHDDKTNSLEPTESVSPPSYSASPRPKMLYNGSQSYSPDQYDPYYAVYDEDGELYKDTDYVQQYNTASLRPAVQQTYRGTPPSRRPVEAYTPRPIQEDYDDALIRGQVNNQNQYQSGIRHSTRGEGNELGFEHIPSSAKTTIYEAPSISTTPTISTTTQRSTTAPPTEAMTPSRYTTRSSTDESPKRDPGSSSQNPSDGPASPFSSTPSPVINFSSLAKPFERTSNTHRLKETLTLTENLETSSTSPSVTDNVGKLGVPNSLSNQDKKKVVSLTSGFSIRRNPSNANNPYTLTVISRPFDAYNKSRKSSNNFVNHKQRFPVISDEGIDNDGLEESVEHKDEVTYNIGRQESNISSRRKDSSEEISDEEFPLYVRPKVIQTPPKFRIKTAPTPPPSPTTKYILKTVIKRPASFSSSNEPFNGDSTENNINTDALIEAGLKNVKLYEQLDAPTNNSAFDIYPKLNEDKTRAPWIRPVEPSLEPLNSQKNFYDRDLELYEDFTTRSISTTSIKTTTQKPREHIKQTPRPDLVTSSKPAYYSYRVYDEDIPHQTTEVFSGAVKNIIKAFFDNFSTTPKPQIIYNTTPRVIFPPEDKIVNIGYQKKPSHFVDEKPFRNNEKRVQIVTEPSFNRFSPTVETITYSGRDNPRVRDFSSTTTMKTTTTSSTTSIPLFVQPETTPKLEETSPYNYYHNNPNNPDRDTFVSKFSNLLPEKLEKDDEPLSKFQKIITEPPRPFNYQKNYNDFDDVTKPVRTSNVQPTVATNEFVERKKSVDSNLNEIVTTTSTTKATTTTKEPTLTTKSLSFPTRPSRVNPAIKLAATNPGGGRRSYQSSSKCSSDNSLQANPKCNEIKYQRPTSSTRGRGSAHYSTLSGSDTPQQQSSNRGTPPTRSRPTLKPSTAVVTNSNPIVDIYAYPPSRPPPVYPQPTPDKTAAKCRKDVCLLPDCYCGGKDIPGDLPVESVPQIVLLTFDDSVNDLNKGLYADLFEKGRVNPNGCPISATFYVSHEWTDYSQVQNLYAAGHEMASHTISHSFGEQFSQKKWNREVAGQREILAAYGGVKLEDVRGMRAPFLSVGGNKMFKMLYDSNFTYDSSLPVYENRPPSWPYTLDYKLFHDCMIPPCPTKSYPGVWEVPMVMWQDLNGGRCSMGDACANPPEAENVFKMILKNFDRHYTTNRAPFGLYYHAAWFTQPHHKEGFIKFLDFINQMPDVWIITNWQALQWVRDPTPISRLNNFQPFQCNYQDRPKKCNNPKVCNLWHKSGVRYMRTCQPCPDVYPWTGKTGIKSSRIDNEIGE